MQTFLRVSEKVRLPAEDFIESATALLGKRGRGKSGGARVILEEVCRAKLPFVVFDPIGLYWGLKSSADGKSKGFEVLVVGGKHADIPLHRKGGRDVARAVVESNAGVVLDFSDQPKAAYREFVGDFADELYRVNETPRLVVLEEASELVPQRLRPDMTTCFEAVERLTSRGRNKGIGVLSIDQRPARIHKDVLTQVDILVCFGVTSPQDRKALREWVEAKADESLLADFEKGLAGLERQHAWVWWPEKDLFEPVRFRDFTTLHPDRTHLRKTGMLEAQPVVTDVSGLIERLGGRMKELAEKAKEEDPRGLRARVQRLEAELEVTQEALDLEKRKKGPPLKSERVEVPVLDAKLVERIERQAQALIAHAVKVGERLTKASGDLLDLAKDARAKVEAVPAGRKDVWMPPVRVRTVADVEQQARRGDVQRAVRKASEEELPDPLKSGELRMLQVLAQRHPLRFTRSQLGTLARFTPSGGTFANYFGRLKRGALIAEDGHGEVGITDAGLTVVGWNVPAAPTTTAEAVEMWCERLKAGEAAMLKVLVKVYPDALDREVLGAETRFAHTGGTFANYLGTLRRNGLVQVEGQAVRASDSLFVFK